MSRFAEIQLLNFGTSLLIRTSLFSPQKESDDDDDEDDEDVPTDSRGKKQKQPALPPSLNPKFANAPKASKPNFKKFAPPPDPSSEVQTATHKHKVVYTDQDGNEQTYFVTKLPHKNFQGNRCPTLIC